MLIFLNGKRHELEDPSPREKLSSWIRKFHRGTKIACEQGLCGSCTVMLSWYDHSRKIVINRSVNACLVPLVSCNGCAVITVEGIGNVKNIHPVQEEIAKRGGSQCGFCTPGFVMSLYTLIRTNPSPTQEDVEEFLSGNLCRCTGYTPILEAGRSFTGKGKMCPSTGKPCDCVMETPEVEEPHDCKDNCERCFPREAIFPPELYRFESKSETYKCKDLVLFSPVSIKEVMMLKEKHENAKIVGGFTFTQQPGPVCIQIGRIPELSKISHSSDAIHVGSAVSISLFIEYLKSLKDLKDHQKAGVCELIKQAKGIASRQIRNVATVGGNIALAHPVSSLSSLFECLGAEAIILNTKLFRRKSSIGKLYKEPFVLTLDKDEMIESFEIPFVGKHEIIGTYKQAGRHTFDWSFVISSFKLGIVDELITSASIIVGGCGEVIRKAEKTCEFLIGKKFEVAFEESLKFLDLDFPRELVSGEKELYRKSLLLGFYHKFYLSFLGNSDYSPPTTSHGVQTSDLTGLGSMPNQSARLQATGEAIYVDDISPIDGELVCVPVLSTVPHGEILSIDATDALKLNGVAAFYTHKDIPGKNIVNSCEWLAVKTVESIGQYVGLIVATTKEIARQAVKLVKVQYKELPAIFTIDECIEQKLAIETKTMSIGQIDAKCDTYLDGEMFIGGQEHWYMETQSALAIPESGDLTVWSSTQSINSVQLGLCSVLGMNHNHVVVKNRRVGGAFGGKENGSVKPAAGAALAAFLLKKPVRMVLDRDDDWNSHGQRHPFLGKWKVGYNNDGTLVSLDICLYCQQGWFNEVSEHVLEAACRSVDGVYKIPNIKCTGYLCKTNTPTNTAFRGFGSPQGLIMIESMMEQLAIHLKMDPNDLRSRNFYESGDKTHYGETINDFTIPLMWKQMIDDSDFLARKKEIAEFNAKSVHVKRGIYMNPTKHGVGLPKFLSQGGALVHLYLDGSVLISHGGIEMGQGINMKVIQIAAHTLGVPIESVHVIENSSDKVILSPPSGGSSGTDMWGTAVLNACQILVERLAGLRKLNPTLNFPAILNLAYLSRINLSAQGFYCPDIENTETFRYFVYGVGCSEVEVDLLTGNYTILRSDIVTDLGQSVNPLIDLGQIQGGFIQGVGYFTQEEFIFSDKDHKYGKSGDILSTPMKYCIPTVKDIPKEIKVHLLKSSSPKRSQIMSSKGSGEPPLFIGCTVFFALKNVIQEHVKEYRRIDSPLTFEKVRLSITEQKLNPGQRK